MKLAALIPWDSLASVYSRKLYAGSGRKSVNIRTVIAALIVKHKLGLDDRRTIEMIQEILLYRFFGTILKQLCQPVLLFSSY